MNIRTLALATLVSSGALALSQPAAAANVSTFDDLALAPDSYFFPRTSTTFTSGAATFNHSFNDWGGDCCHTDWVYSNLTDTTTEGYLNQHSAIAGGGAEGSANYAVANIGAPVASFAAPVSVLGAWFTNSTYAALSMLNGDGFAKQFGGASGSDADWFMLTITGLDSFGQSTGSVDFMLADYRFADSADDYIVTDWRWVDLSALGTVSSLQFALASSDNGAFGMNTPAYFAMDNLAVAAVPEPEQAALLLAGLALVGAVARRRMV